MNSSIDKLVFRFAGILVLVSLTLAHTHSPYWLWLAAFVGMNMLQASFTGICPLAKFLAYLGAPYGEAFHAGKPHIVENQDESTVQEKSFDRRLQSNYRE